MSESIKRARLEAKIGYSFSDADLLERALTHRSMTDLRMERQEFLGDAVLGLVISQYLHHHYPELPEGKLSRMRSALVRKESLYEVALVWKLTQYLHVGESERMVGGGIKSPSIAANAVCTLEAITPPKSMGGASGIELALSTGIVSPLTRATPSEA